MKAATGAAGQAITFGQAAVVAVSGLTALQGQTYPLHQAPDASATSKPGTPGEARSHDDRRRMSRRELPAGMPAREGLKAPSPPWSRPLAEAAEHQARLLPPARCRHPGNVIRLHVETAC